MRLSSPSPSSFFIPLPSPFSLLPSNLHSNACHKSPGCCWPQKVCHRANEQMKLSKLGIEQRAFLLPCHSNPNLDSGRVRETVHSGCWCSGASVQQMFRRMCKDSELPSCSTSVLLGRRDFWGGQEPQVLREAWNLTLVLPLTDIVIWGKFLIFRSGLFHL